MRNVIGVLVAFSIAAGPAQAQKNPFKLPKLKLAGQVEYELGGDMTGTATTAFDGERMMSRSKSVTKMMGKETATSSWTLVTADSMYVADLDRKTGIQSPNLLPFMAKAYDGLDQSGRQRFHSNLEDMTAMFSRAFDISSLGSVGEKKGEKTVAGEVCEEREIMGFTICTMKRGPRIALQTTGDLICFRMEQTATSVSLAAPPASAFEKPAGIVFHQDAMMQNPDSMAQGFVGYLASQTLTDSLAKASAELEKAKAQAAAEGKPTEMTAADKEQVRAACEVVKNLDLNKVLAAAAGAMVDALKEAALESAKKSATNKLKGLIKKPKFP